MVGDKSDRVGGKDGDRDGNGRSGSDGMAAAVAAADPSRRQILFYAPVGLLGGTFTCSRCGVTGRQPDVLDHAVDCPYRPGAHRPAGAPAPGDPGA
jgi:hypothetical protein